MGSAYYFSKILESGLFVHKCMHISGGNFLKLKLLLLNYGTLSFELLATGMTFFSKLPEHNMALSQPRFRPAALSVTVPQIMTITRLTSFHCILGSDFNMRSLISLLNLEIKS